MNERKVAVTLVAAAALGLGLVQFFAQSIPIREQLPPTSTWWHPAQTIVQPPPPVKPVVRVVKTIAIGPDPLAEPDPLAPYSGKAHK